MSKNNKLLIINTGGTFNKVYNQINGKLEVPQNNDAVKSILKASKIDHVKIKGLIYKDSLDITDEDRRTLCAVIENSPFKKILIIHGTDTIDKTASFLADNIKNRSIVLTASMQPYSIDAVEAVSNLMTGYGFLQNRKRNGVFISMHGFVKKYNKIKKNKKLGVFECL